jgi:hypothetical protein
MIRTEERAFMNRINVIIKETPENSLALQPLEDTARTLSSMK